MLESLLYFNVSLPFHFDESEYFKYFYRPLGEGICVEYNDDEMIGKTIDFVDMHPTRNYIFMGFTDGTYAYQEYCDTNKYRTTAENYRPNMGWKYKIVPPFGMLFNSKTDNDGNISITLTKIGEWFRNKSKVNMVELMEKMDKAAAEQSELNKKLQRESDLEEYKRLKEKLGID